ncbi:hypothetical protein EUTSA_v10002759mg [Eutrema salsugineum]|uniref:Uncharacterized protein n=1 Tax=Eutrema salsugineum TaxID=72664 RepID=V4LB71_EUTSA|nr:hypothetical protein EUTSA_v10002759mg [Eutrema salsugineum]
MLPRGTAKQDMIDNGNFIITELLPFPDLSSPLTVVEGNELSSATRGLFRRFWRFLLITDNIFSISCLSFW